MPIILQPSGVMKIWLRCLVDFATGSILLIVVIAGRERLFWSLLMSGCVKSVVTGITQKRKRKYACRMSWSSRAQTWSAHEYVKLGGSRVRGIFGTGFSLIVLLVAR